ncbi:MAG TPA: SgcJ/EcaC family oxidoreductase [Gemmatimonadaceae bacterium]|nr:SgcJ/EcaC family oxidoreductase [Gemmatimonadaceae bacterium]
MPALRVMGCVVIGVVCLHVAALDAQPAPELSARVRGDARAALAIAAGTSAAALRVTESRATSPDTSALRRSVEHLITTFTTAWAHANPDSIAALFAADADVVIPTGVIVRGRSAIRRFYASAFANGYIGSRSTVRLEALRRLTPRIAVLDASWRISGAQGSSGAPRAPEAGLLTAVLVRDSGDRGGWRIAALREQTSGTHLEPFPGDSAR